MTFLHAKGLYEITLEIPLDYSMVQVFTVFTDMLGNQLEGIYTQKGTILLYIASVQN